MNMLAPFGFVTGCHAGDKFMAQATLASMRHYCPGIPICLIVDGDVDVHDLQKQYDLIVLHIADLPDPRMRKLLGGSTRSKLAAMWEGPFERYVWMDSDVVVWGDFTAALRNDVDFQIFWREAYAPDESEEIPDWFRHYFFDPDKLREADPNFEWRGLHYFSDGVFASRRGAISIQEYEKVVQWRIAYPGLWPRDFNTMPFLNYLVHSKQQRGELVVGVADLQHIWMNHGIEEIATDLAGCRWRFPAQIKRPRLLHFCGQKPHLHNMRAYSRPFTIARLEHHRRTHGEIGAWGQLLKEEAPIVAKKIKRRFGRT